MYCGDKKCCKYMLQVTLQHLSFSMKQQQLLNLSFRAVLLENARIFTPLSSPYSLCNNSTNKTQLGSIPALKHDLLFCKRLSCMHSFYC